MGAQEARAFADGKRTVLDIADAVSSEFGAIDVTLFIDYFKEQAKNKALELGGVAEGRAAVGRQSKTEN